MIYTVGVGSGSLLLVLSGVVALVGDGRALAISVVGPAIHVLAVGADRQGIAYDVGGGFALQILHEELGLVGIVRKVLELRAHRCDLGVHLREDCTLRLFSLLCCLFGGLQPCLGVPSLVCELGLQLCR